MGGTSFFLLLCISMLTLFDKYGSVERSVFVLLMFPTTILQKKESLYDMSVS